MSIMMSKRGLARTGLIVGSLLTLSPFVGLAGTVIGMIGAFNELGRSGIADPNALSGHIRLSLLSTTTGLFLCPIGVVIFTLSLIVYARRKPMTPPPLP
jgi:biopolymer transport protein ExbB/TolQ